MNVESVLLTFAQVGLGLTGFSSVVIAFRQSSTPLSSAESAGLKLLLEHTLALIVYAISPLVWFYTLGQERWAWQISSSFLALFLVIEVILQEKRRGLLAQHGSTPTFPKFFFWGFLIPSIDIGLLQLANLWYQSAAIYLWGLTWLLLASIIQFWLFMIVRTRFG